MSIVNTGTEPDRLVSATSPAAASVEITGDTEIPAGRVLSIEGEPAAPAAAVRRGPADRSPAASPAPAEPSGEPATPGDEIGSAGRRATTRAAEPTSAAPPTRRSRHRRCRVRRSAGRRSSSPGCARTSAPG